MRHAENDAAASGIGVVRGNGAQHQRGFGQERDQNLDMLGPAPRAAGLIIGARAPVFVGLFQCQQRFNTGPAGHWGRGQPQDAAQIALAVIIGQPVARRLHQQFGAAQR